MRISISDNRTDRSWAFFGGFNQACFVSAPSVLKLPLRPVLLGNDYRMVSESDSHRYIRGVASTDRSNQTIKACAAEEKHNTLAFDSFDIWFRERRLRS